MLNEQSEPHESWPPTPTGPEKSSKATLTLTLSPFHQRLVIENFLKTQACRDLTRTLPKTWNSDSGTCDYDFNFILLPCVYFW